MADEMKPQSPRSSIYIGEVMHARSEPVTHRFRYPVYVYCFDLDELPVLDRRVKGFGYNRHRPISLHDSDYLQPVAGSIRDKLLAMLRSSGGPADAVARIDTITSARFFGKVFNPVCFHFCRDASDTVLCVVAEVNNTFGEKHLYVLLEGREPKRGFAFSYRTSKRFHVSPFFPVEGEYEFHFADPRDRLDVLIHYKREGRTVFVARLRGSQKRSLTSANLWRTVGRYPLTALKTMPRILWQAGRLYFQRRLPVFHKPPPSDAMTLRGVPPSRLARLWMKPVRRHFNSLTVGRLKVKYPDLSVEEFGDRSAQSAITMTIHSHRFFKRVVLSADIGFGESYQAGEWETDDLAGLLRLFIRNRAHAMDHRIRTAVLGRLANWFRHVARTNTVRGSRRNIAEHYDLSNDFFRLFLDPSMAYSSGIYADADTTLEQAQIAKFATIIERLELTSETHLLEIGCGWAGFALEAVKRSGCRVTGITVSQEQHDLALERVREAGLQERIDIQLCDYRHVSGSYDRIVSIEMLEAVGHSYLPEFFRACDRLLAAGGGMVHQVITIPDERYARYRRSSDWIRKHIFPGGHLPSPVALLAAMSNSAGFDVSESASIGLDYARTLRDWRERLDANEPALRALGYDDNFLNTWRYYFAYCEAGFDERIIDDVILVVNRKKIA